MNKVYKVTDDGGESVCAVADSEEKARQCFLDYMDPDPEGDLEFRILPDDETLTITDDDTGEKVTKTALEWVESYDPTDNGLLCASMW